MSSVPVSTTRSELLRPVLSGRGLDGMPVAGAIQWRPGDRLGELFQGRFEAFERDGASHRPAIEVDGLQISFAELDRQANQFARELQALGVSSGDRVGLLLDRSVHAYACLLALVRLEAVYVPLDLKYPPDRIAFIAADASLKFFIATRSAAALLEAIPVSVIELEAAGEAASHLSDQALERDAAGPAGDDALCYIIYTSGSTGKPKGVAVNHSSICNFIAIAARHYGYRPGDRAYQGMSFAFDFSVEELWVPLAAGATLVPAPSAIQLVGEELASFLSARRITAMCAVPTLLATIDAELADLRLLIVSGEACPGDLVTRWWRPWRRMLNVYGPTEATVTATWCELRPGEPVTIGVPLPTYWTAILHPEFDRLAEPGEAGELAIAGIGLAVGYVNRPDLTAKAFIADFLELGDNPSARLYRTGDMARITAAGRIEYLGRIDTQVKIRGYRIELAEIENVLLEMPGIAQAVVTTQETLPGVTDLVAYFTRASGGQSPSREAIFSGLRQRLPGYMVPAYLEEIERIPLLASQKADRKALPSPVRPRLTLPQAAPVEPGSELERCLADTLCRTLGIEQVSVGDNFFEDLGAHSLLMARFAAALNREMQAARVSISEIYRHPTIARLAAVVAPRLEAPGTDARAEREAAHEASDAQYYLCGALQFCFYAAVASLYAGLAIGGLTWIAGGDDFLSKFARATGFAAGSLAVLMLLPIAAKWLVIGRWRAGRIPLWSLAYFRFWMVRQLVEQSPWSLFRGSALFNVYLRLLGARIGDNALILSRTVPLITDLLSIGDDAVLRKQCWVMGYRAENGFLRVGPIAIGARATIGEGAVVDLGTEIGDDGQLAHASALLEGQRIAPGTACHGSPAEPTENDYRHFANQSTSRARRVGFAAARLVSVVVAAALAATLSIAGAEMVSGQSSAAVVDDLSASMSATITFDGLAGLALTAALLLTGLLGLGLIVQLIVMRLLRRLIEPGRVYPLYGLHHMIADALDLVSNVPAYHTLFGDSSFIVRYLGWLGVAQPELRQTGSNFGTATAIESPADFEVGSGAMVSDGLSVINRQVGSREFRLMPARLGTGSFVGNIVYYPAAGRTGDNCLLASKVMVPVTGAMRHDVGLLGSPSFEIPRRVVNSNAFDPVPRTAAGKARLEAKNRYNLRTALLYLLAQWGLLFGLLAIGYAAMPLYRELGPGALAICLAGWAGYTLVYSLAVERLSLLRVRMKPSQCTIHDPHFWWVERHWKLGETPIKGAFRGTPLRGWIYRALGAKVGRKLFDDGSVIPEKPLVAIGDNVCINAGVSIQAHALEDGLFRSDRIVIGDGCSIGPAGYVHYGVEMAPSTELSPDGFLMKGSRTRRAERWQGNPAEPV